MKTPNIPKAVKVKEIIRYTDDVYVLIAEASFCTGWDFESQEVHIKADVGVLAEILRLENSSQAGQIEEVLLNMLSYGQPPQVDIKELTGDYLALKNSELVVRYDSGKPSLYPQYNLPVIIDVFARFEAIPLAQYLHLENEFSADILTRTFADFQKLFFLIDRGYESEAASRMTQTDNPLAAMVYNKIKALLDPEEVSTPMASHGNDPFEEERYIFSELLTAEQNGVPF
jgi:hypothetical protein